MQASQKLVLTTSVLELEFIRVDSRKEFWLSTSLYTSSIALEVDGETTQSGGIWAGESISVNPGSATGTSTI
jgi:hypothetical protein